MRLTITKKIAAAVVGLVILCVTTMVWLSSQNLQRGFVHYLNQIEIQELDELASLISDAYRERGSLEFLRHDPRALGDLIRRQRGRLAEDQPPPRRPAPPPLARGDVARPDQGPPQARPQPPPREAARPPQPDPWGFGPRLSMLDDQGQPLFGPPNPQSANTRQVLFEGRLIGTLSLAPLQKAAQATDSNFVRNQIRDMVLLGVLLVCLASMLAVWLARHFLGPVASLRAVTQRIAHGEFHARVPVHNQDELAELAEHVNAMAQTLEQAEQLRRRVMADISHELRTPLTIIRGELEALLDGIRLADKAALESLHHEVLRLNSLVDDLYQLALADAGDLHYHFRPVELGPLLQQQVDRAQVRADTARLQLNLALPVEAVWVEGDAGRLAQVIGNLLQNSLRYTHPGGRLLLSLERLGEQAIITVADSAPGVPQEALMRLFDRLYRVDAARSREQGGSGLGLAICKALVLAHQGEISALPSPLGGVSIVIRLPRIATPDKEA